MRFIWSAIPGPTRALTFQADILTCRGYIIVPILRSTSPRDGPDHWRLYAPSAISGEPQFWDAYPTERCAKDNAREHLKSNTPKLGRFEDKI